MHIKTALLIGLSAFYISAFANPNPGDQANHPMPPKEAMDACSGKAKDDACSFTGPGGHNLEGKCFNGPDGNGPLACAPIPPKEAVDACAGKNDGDACSFTGMNNNMMEGKCFKTPMGDVACRPDMKPNGQNGMGMGTGMPADMPKDMK
ncbi:MAG: hypothetical protein AB7V32_11480 [Candidatus Berkiella sp.]